MPYRDYHVAVYESLDAQRPDANNRARTQYFCTPIVPLEPDTVEHRFIGITDRHVVRFTVTMWSPEVEQIVTEYMRNKLGMPMENAEVKPMPFEQILLACKSKPGKCKCSKKWQPNQMHNRRTFKLKCPSEAEARRVADALRS